MRSFVLLGLALSAQAVAQTGSISGTIGYPSEEIPAMRIHAITAQVKSGGSVTTARNQRRFTISGLAPGSYFVVAYLVNKAESDVEAGAWTRHVTCGMKADCSDHSLLAVLVSEGKTTSEVNVADWYAKNGTFPPEPGSVAAAPNCAAAGSQLEQDGCNLRAYEAADRALNAEYRRVMSALDKQPKCQERLREAQRAWIRYRDEHCKYEGATGYKGRTTECLGEVTGQRVGYLKQQLDLETCNP